MSEDPNPYRPPAIPDAGTDNGGSGSRDSRGRHREPPRVWRTKVAIGVWTGVVSLAAVPSFMLGLTVTEGRWIGMTAGIAAFIAGYVAIDRLTFHWPMRNDRRWRLALRSTYVTRMMILALFPVAFGLDMFCGLFAMALVEEVSGSRFVPLVNAQDSEPAGMSDTLAFVTTLVQGAFMHVPLLIAFGFWALVYALAVRERTTEPAIETAWSDEAGKLDAENKASSENRVASNGMRWSEPIRESAPSTRADR